MHLVQPQQSKWPVRHQEFYQNFLDMTASVTNSACLANSPDQVNFRQFGHDGMAVGIDLVKGGLIDYKGSFTLRDFKAATLGQGDGQVALACLTDQADQDNMRLELRAFAELDEEKNPIIPQAKLVEFYQKAGFFLQPKDSPQSLLPIMIRPPQRRWF